MLSKEENVEHVWISNEHVTEFKNYIFKEEFNENHNYWSSIKMTKNDESIAEFSKSTEKLTSQKTSKSVSQSSQYFVSSSNIILLKHKSNSQINFISSQSFKIMNYQAKDADHLFIRFFSMKSRKTTENRMNEIDFSSDEKIISAKIEDQSDLLINIAVKKLVTVKVIVEKMNKINIKHVEKWMKEIEFFKQVRENAGFNIHEIIIIRINEIKRIMKTETAKRDEIRESMKHFSKTQERIFKHNRDELSKMLKNWGNLKNKAAQLMKKKNKLNIKERTSVKRDKLVKKEKTKEVIWQTESSKQKKKYSLNAFEESTH